MVLSYGGATAAGAPGAAGTAIPNLPNRNPIIEAFGACAIGAAVKYAILSIKSIF